MSGPLPRYRHQRIARTAKLLTVKPCALVTEHAALIALNYERFDMALLYPPSVGEIYMCAFPECFKEPEMVKTRAVLIVSPKCDGRRGLWTVVPLSLTTPNPIRSYHCLVPARFMPKPMQATGGDRWAKCDMIYAFSQDRLELCKGHRDPSTGKRKYEKGKVDLEHIQIVRRGVAAALGIDSALFE